ncbi:MAG: DUF4329 domain-containing protein [Pseudomonadales bacterium]
MLISPSKYVLLCLMCSALLACGMQPAQSSYSTFSPTGSADSSSASADAARSGLSKSVESGVSFQLKSGSEGVESNLGKRAMLSLEVFDSEIGSVSAAMSRFNPHSIESNREYIGAIVEIQGKFRYLVARGLPNQDKVSVHLPVPKNAEIVAFWHTHGAAGPHRHLFSAVDTRLVRSSGKPFYMADAKGDVRVYKPDGAMLSVGEKRRMGIKSTARIARGEYIGSLNASEASRQLHDREQS